MIGIMYAMKLISTTISVKDLSEMSQKMFGNLVKAVVDVDKQTMMVDAPMHADQEREMLGLGSKQGDLWGINLYPDMYGDEDFIEFDSMINIRPNQGNHSRGIEDKNIQSKIIAIVNKLVTE